MHWVERNDLANDSDEKVLEEAFHSRRRGEHRDAAERFMTVFRRDETNPFAPIEAARSHAALMEYELMRELLTLAKRLADGEPFVDLLIGDALASVHFSEEALAAYRAAASGAKDEVEPIARILGCLERMNQTEEAFALLESLPPKVADHAELLPIRATLALRRGAADEALSLVNTRPAQAAEASLLITAASALERLGRFDDAWAAMMRAKRAAAAKPEAEFQRRLYPPYLAFLAKVREQVSSLPCQTAPRADDTKRLAFLLGHPRSGTTVVERILDHHPDIASASEYPAFELGIMEAAYRLQNPDFLSAGLLRPADRDAIRHDYFDRMARVFPGGVAGRLLVDKNPGLTDGIHGVAAVFPEAKYIVMLRDPRDVILSCLFRDFGETRLGVACHTPEGAADAFASTMGQWLFMRDKLPCDSWMEVRYEQFVDQPDAMAGDMLRFLGCDAGGISTEAALRGDAFIRTPTYAQIGRKVRPDAVGKWMNYRSHFEVLRDRIEPIMNALGYAW